MKVFVIGISILSIICVPYIYYAVQINAFGQANKPEGYHMPRYDELSKTLVGAIVLNVIRVVIFHWMLGPLFYRYSKVQDDEEERVRYARKASECFWSTTYFIASVYWGWSIMKDR